MPQIESRRDFSRPRPNLERYLRFMDSAMRDKTTGIVPWLRKYDTYPATFLSVGAGSGKLERIIAETYPDQQIIGLDASLPMLEKINDVPEFRLYRRKLPVLQAEALALPFRPESADAVIASSVVHEIASYTGGYSLNGAAASFFRDTATVLKPGGRLIIRDFMQPSDPDRIVLLRIGSAISGDPMDPSDFLNRFSADFRGNDLSYLAGASEGDVIPTRLDHALEIMAHFSWSKSYREEVPEKYAYLPVDAYAFGMSEAFAAAGFSSAIVSATAHIQDGYREHLTGRFDLFEPETLTPIDIPILTGTVVLEKC